MSFVKMNIKPEILKALNEMKIYIPTEIQQKAIPPALEGYDIIGQAMTGSGKTVAFSLPILEKIEHDAGVQALILVPTRELCIQVAGEIRKFARYINAEVCEIYGGVSINPQINKLRYADIVVGTPGRILDHMNRNTINLKFVKFLVLDEADRMLDMGFIDDIKRIINKLPSKRQTMLFSATMPEEILKIARNYMHNPVRVMAQLEVSAEKLRQFYYDVRQEDKLSLLVHLINKERPTLALVFCSTRSMTDIAANVLFRNNIEAKAIHGGLSQERRSNLMAGFHRGRPHILVATDVAARGLDIPNVSHVFHYDSPKTTDEYKHRIGRTARIGKEGKSILLLSQRDHQFFRTIIRNIPYIRKAPQEQFARLRFQRERSHEHDVRPSAHRRRFPRRPRY